MKVVPETGKVIIECQVCSKKREVFNRGRIPKTCSPTCRKRLSRGQSVDPSEVTENKASDKSKTGLEWERISGGEPSADLPEVHLREITFLFRVGQYAEMIDKVLSYSHVDPQGCWNWPNLTESGYAKNKLYRRVLEAKIGKSLGSQAAHHMCANSACVNPEHLQPVTHYDNVAEMLARHSYIKRIRDLESALKELDPEHPLLKVAELK